MLDLMINNTVTKGSIVIYWLLVCLLLGMLITKVLVTIVTANMGFDLTDEGVCLLWYAYPDKDPNPFYYFHKIVLGIFPFIEWDIVSTRLLKVCSELTVLGIVVTLVYSKLEERLKTIGNAALILGISGLGYFALVYAKVFFEGDMSYLFVILSWAMPLLFIEERKRKWLWLAVLFAGAVVGMQFFNKFSASVLSFALVTILLIYFTRKVSYVLLLLLGIALGVASFFMITGYHPSVWYQEYIDGYTYVLEGLEYDPVALLLFYLVDGLALLLLALLPLGLFSAFKYVAVKLNAWQRPHTVFAVLVFVCYAAGFLFLPEAYSDARYKEISLMFNYWYMPLVSMVLYLFFWVGNVKDKSKEANAMLILLLLSPLVSLAGTGSSLAMSAASYIIPWFGILAYLLVRYYNQALVLGLILVAVTVIGGFLYFQWEAPFRYLASESEQTVMIQGPREEIYVDAKLASFVNGTKAELDKASIPSGYPIVALHNLPGLVYLLDGYSPATPWYFELGWLNDAEMSANAARSNCLNMSRIPGFDSRPPVFLINAREIDIVTPCLQELEYDLEGDYMPPKAIWNPYVAMELQAFSKQANDSLLIFIPN